jgi:hypothetical protein
VPDRILIPLSRYITAVLDDGDYLNDWLTRFSSPMADALMAFGKRLAEMLGA